MWYPAYYQYVVPNGTSPGRGFILVEKKQPQNLISPVGTLYNKHFIIITFFYRTVVIKILESIKAIVREKLSFID
jgi:hypothetical protein